MTMESFATPYPVIFYDGQKEHDKGHLGVHSVLKFKRFQSILSQKIGIPANQLSAVFVCRRTLKETEKRQKLPINENTNFSIILNQHNPSRERDCHFLVSMKKSKKDRKGSTKRRTNGSENGEDDGSVSSRSDSSPPDERPPKLDTGDSMSSPEPSSPVSKDLESFSDGAIVANQNDGKTGLETPFLKREIGEWNSSRAVRQNICQSERQENSCSPKFEIAAAILSRRRKQDEKTYGRQVEASPIVAGHSSKVFSIASRAEAYQDRPMDGMRSPILLQRNGIVTSTIAANPLASFSSVPTLQQPVYPSFQGTTGMVLPRIPTASSCLSSALNLQQAQAHYLSLQNQHPSQMHLSAEAFAQLKGVVRDLASIDDGQQTSSGVCEYCCSCKEKNINPTPFHICVRDRVTRGFRGPSPAGPIERPVKRLEAAA